jgi:hypothetical protein
MNRLRQNTTKDRKWFNCCRIGDIIAKKAE